jgi:ankyrin repeat protein
MLSHRFRWVFCQLEVLRRCFPANLRRTLEELPTSLDETYKRILNEINNVNQLHAYQLLQCLTVALRPLRVEELVEILAFDLNMGGLPKLNADWRWEDQEEAVLSACSSLVSIIIDNGARVVQFSHFSVKEFLTSDRLKSCTDEASRFYIPIEPSHAILAQACLGAIFRLDDRTHKGGVKSIPLYNYAVAYWVGHVQVGNVEFRIKGALDHFFDSDKPHFSTWHDGLTARRPLYHIILESGPLSRSPLHFAAGRGFCGLVKRLIIKHPEQLNHLGGKYGTPLHESVHEGQIKVVKLLLAHNADINSRCANRDNFFTPLHIAVLQGHLDIATLLLSEGADVNLQTEGGYTPLHFTAREGILEFTRILLEHNAEVDARNGAGDTPFFGASESGDLDLVQLFLKHNADVHARAKRGATPLHMAVAKGHLGVAEILLKRNAEVNSQDDEGSTPLLRVSGAWSQYSDVVRCLVQRGDSFFVADTQICVVGQ